MTGEHASGTDRIAEVARRCCPDADLLVNIQGDEPELDPRQIDTLVDTMRKHPETEMATLAAPIRSREVLEDKSCTKVVCAKDGRALYFSRAAIPVCRDASPEDIETLLAQDPPWKLHLGIYAYRREFLERLTGLPVSPLERLEKLEQLAPWKRERRSKSPSWSIMRLASTRRAIMLNSSPAKNGRLDGRL